MKMKGGGGADSYKARPMAKNLGDSVIVSYLGTRSIKMKFTRMLLGSK
jgi:hypothetical protein